MKEPTPRETREPARHTQEHLNSPVTDPGYFPYPRLPGGLQETVTGVDEPKDPLGFVPPYHPDRKEDDDQF